MSERVAILAAMETEIRPLVSGWRRTQMTVEGLSWPAFETEQAMLLCGGIGYEASRRAGEALVKQTNAKVLMSVGLAGALQANQRVAEVIRPAEVVNAATGQKFGLAGGRGTLVSSPVVAGLAEKRAIGQRFPEAVAVDMEGAAAAEVAQRHGIRCVLLKAISDELEFPMPPLGRFIDAHGRLQTLAVVRYAAFRPWTWLTMISLGRNSEVAAGRLAEAVAPILRGNVLENLKLTTESRVY